MQRILTLFVIAMTFLASCEDDQISILVGHFYHGPIGSKPGENKPFSIEFQIISTSAGYRVSNCKVIFGTMDFQDIWEPSDIDINLTHNSTVATFIFLEGDKELRVINFTKVNDYYTSSISYTSPSGSLSGTSAVFTKF